MPLIYPFGFLSSGLAAPINLGTVAGNSGVATTMVITTTASVPAGSLIVVASCVNGAAVPTGIADSASNSYTLLADSMPLSGRSGGGQFAYAKNVASLAAGSSITITMPSGQSSYCATAMACAAQTNPLDTSNHVANGTGAGTHTVSTGTLAQAAEIVIGMIVGQNNSDFTNDAAFTALTGIQQSAAAGAMSEIVWAYKIVAATTTVSYAPSSSTGGNGWAQDVISFKQ